jgi:hypothetical protein
MPLDCAGLFFFVLRAEQRVESHLGSGNLDVARKLLEWPMVLRPQTVH